MSPEPSRKLVLITGATGGIGRATALAFARTGTYDLALHYHTASPTIRADLTSALTSTFSPDQTQQTPANPPQQPRRAFFQADLSSYAAVRALHAAVVERFGRGPDVLFNNAGSACGVSGVAALGEVGGVEVFEKAWRVNCGSGVLLTELCLLGMEERGWGRVVFCGSVAAFTGGVVGPHYASSKSALHGFVHWLAGNVAKKGITVNVVAPAMIEGTSMMASAEDESVKERIQQRLPVGRLGRPEEIADTVMWMVNTGYVTNKVITVDGGYHPY